MFSWKVFSFDYHTNTAVVVIVVGMNKQFNRKNEDEERFQDIFVLSEKCRCRCHFSFLLQGQIVYPLIVETEQKKAKQNDIFIKKNDL